LSIVNRNGNNQYTNAWSKLDEQILKNVYKYKENRPEIIQVLFPQRTWRAIGIKANKLGVHQEKHSIVLRKCRDCGLEIINPNLLQLFCIEKTSYLGRENLCKNCRSKRNSNNYIENADRLHKLRKDQYKQKVLHGEIFKRPSLIKEQARAKAQHSIPLVNGELCSICNSNKRLERHHSNYNKPMVVIVVCKKCHAKIHSKYQQPIKELNELVK
jgi:hypothetical protein